MTYVSTTASEMLVRIGALQREIVEASAKGFHDGDTVKLASELVRKAEELEQEAMREWLSLGGKEAA